MPTEQQIATAALGLMNAALPATVRAYDPDKVPATRPTEYLVLTVVRRSEGVARAGRFMRTGWSFYLMGVSQTSVWNARNSLRLAGGAIENDNLAVSSETSTPVKFDSGRPVAPDDGWFSGVNVYTCTF